MSEVTIEITRPKLMQVAFAIVGLTPLLNGRPPEMIAKPSAAEKRKNKARAGGLPDVADDAKTEGTPEQQFESSLYPMPDGTGYGFPSAGIQKACAVGLQRFNPINPKFARDTLPVFYGATFMLDEMIPIVGDGPTKRHDLARNSRGKLIDVYRGSWAAGWTMRVAMEFDERIITLQRLTNALDLAGRKIGIGPWRPERSGRFGRFCVTGAEVIA